MLIVYLVVINFNFQGRIKERKKEIVEISNNNGFSRWVQMNPPFPFQRVHR